MKNFKSFPLRVAAMLAVLVIVAVGYFTTTGIGNSCAIGLGDISLICPLGALLSMIADKTAIPMAILSLAVVLVVCLLLGKVFCAWICPVSFMSPKRPLLDRLGRKKTQGCVGAQPVEGAQPGESVQGCAGCAGHTGATGCGKRGGVRFDGRHVVLLAALVSTLVFGYPVFCLACPVGLTFSTVLMVMQLFVYGKTTWTVIVFPVIVFVELFILPRWCHNLCPLGALMSLFSAGNRTLRPVIDQAACVQTAQGKHCGLCEAVCPEGINLHDVAAGRTTLNDCSKCRACADVCPAHAISFPFLSPKGGTAAKAASVGEASEAEAKAMAVDSAATCEPEDAASVASTSEND